MDESAPSALAIENALARELARHYTDCDPAETLDAALRCPAAACWKRARETPDPYTEQTAAHALVLRALDGREFRDARKVFKAGTFTVEGKAI